MSLDEKMRIKDYHRLFDVIIKNKSKNMIKIKQINRLDTVNYLTNIFKEFYVQEDKILNVNESIENVIKDDRTSKQLKVRKDEFNFEQQK